MAIAIVKCRSMRSEVLELKPQGKILAPQPLDIRENLFQIKKYTNPRWTLAREAFTPPNTIVALFLRYSYSGKGYPIMYAAKRK